MRAEIAHRCGFPAAALKDISKALELAPDDLAANRRLMQWGDVENRTAAARRLIELDRDMALLGEAVTHLQGQGETALGAIHRVGDGLTGWAVWQGRGQMSLRIEADAGAVSHSIKSDPQHALAAKAEHAASFSVVFPPSTTRRVVSLKLGRRALARSAFPAPLATSRAAHGAIAKGNLIGRTRSPAADITIIVPIYDDFEATRRCLECLMQAVHDHDRIMVVLVDDATPDERIAALLDSVATAPNVHLIRNSHNLGFIGAVNRALHATPCGDVILLNADTVVPKGFALRLNEAAYSAPDIGTVTPLSNNGEATSLPLAFTANPLPPIERVAHLDAIAARVNAGRVVDMPDGIGFCLYITRQCLDAVGGLSDHYHRGYLEDVDLCLRARQHGFRNVCAPSVYVGHAGSASFRAEKRALVVLNLARLRLRFPDYRSESATFKALDPLKSSRGAIERELIAGQPRTIVLSGPGAAADVAKQFAGCATEPALLALFNKNGTTLALRDAGDDFPQSLDFKLPADQAALTETIIASGPSRVVLADPANIPAAFVRDLIDGSAAFDVLVTDGGLLCRGGGFDEKGRLCPELLSGETCNCRSNTGESWLDLLSRESCILAPDMAAEAFLRRHLPSDLVHRVRLVGRSDNRSPTRPKAVASRGTALGLLPIGHGTGDFAFLRDVVRCVRQRRPDARIVVLGETLDDLALMALGGVTVTGRLSVDELGGVAALHRLDRLLIARRAPLFGHPMIEAALSEVGVPLAFFDWSFGNIGAHEADLPLAPTNDVAATAEDLFGWMASPW
ncbi:hypothetical protein XI05_18970 [Bradyrhizobium sp. CCBAU 11357]|nr:hypothetical protein [Bradyrhizobium sp. CCBAU 11357]